MAGDSESLRRTLEDRLGPGRVRGDEETLATFSMDASPYVVRPTVVVRAESEAEIAETVRVCARFGVPITPRAGGTSLSGAAVGPGVVLDVSPCRAVLEFHSEASTVHVQAGLPLRELTANLDPRGFFFPPDPGSADVCCIGGMIGHNSAGFRTVKYGTTASFVRSLRVVLADGRILEAGDLALDGPAWNQAVQRVPAIATVREVVERHRAAIEAARRPVAKIACGYDLFAIAEALDRGVFPLARLFVGSEGTLGVVTEAVLGVLPKPAARVTVLLALERLEDLGTLVQNLLPLGPSVMEAIAGASLRILDAAALAVPRSAHAILVIEFDAGDLEQLVRKTLREASAVRLGASPQVARDPEGQAHLWKVRRSILPTLLNRPGSRKPWGFVEDPVVPRDRVPEFIAFLEELTQRYETEAGIYGHIGDGNVHYRPLFDLADPEDLHRMQSMREEFDTAVLERFGGALSAEHGIGRLRAEVLPRMWGREVWAVMRSIKEALDPQGLLNPGVLFGSTPWWHGWHAIGSPRG